MIIFRGMKKIVLIPDSFKGTMSSSQICSLMREAALRHFPSVEVVEIPIADGGEGTVDAFLSTCRRGEKMEARVQGPYGKPMDSFWGKIGDSAVVEMAACAGLPLTRENRDPSVTTTYGVGQLVEAAWQEGCRQIVVGLGGSGTNDGGCGMAAALGVRFLDALGRDFVPVGGTLKDIARIDVSRRNPLVGKADLVAMCDTGNPLFGFNGAAYVFAPQKGADARMVEELDSGLRHLDKIVQKDLGVDASRIPGVGAAGGCGFGMVAFFGASVRMGIDMLLEAVGFDSLLEGVDYVFTGEGKVDGQSLGGKVISGVARHARQADVPVIVVAGDVGEDVAEAYDKGVAAVFSTNRVARDFSKVRFRCMEDLSQTMDNIFRLLKISEMKTRETIEAGS